MILFILLINLVLWTPGAVQSAGYENYRVMDLDELNQIVMDFRQRMKKDLVVLEDIFLQLSYLSIELIDFHDRESDIELWALLAILKETMNFMIKDHTIRDMTMELVHLLINGQQSATDTDDRIVREILEQHIASGESDSEKLVVKNRLVLSAMVRSLDEIERLAGPELERIYSYITQYVLKVKSSGKHSKISWPLTQLAREGHRFTVFYLDEMLGAADDIHEILWLICTTGQEVFTCKHQYDKLFAEVIRVQQHQLSTHTPDQLFNEQTLDARSSYFTPNDVSDQLDLTDVKLRQFGQIDMFDNATRLTNHSDRMLLLRDLLEARARQWGLSLE